ncbi:hypothetical protein HKD37_05G012264 [Glycine soja]
MSKTIFCHETWSLIDVIHKACNLAHSYQLSSDMMLNSLPQFSTSSCNQGDLRWNAPVHDPRDHTARSRGFSFIRVDFDSRNAIQVLDGNCSRDHPCCNVVEEIHAVYSWKFFLTRMEIEEDE